MDHIIKGLRDLCVQHLEGNVTVENVMDILITGSDTHQHRLIKAAFEFAFKKRGMVKPSDWDDNINKNSFMKALEDILFGSE